MLSLIALLACASVLAQDAPVVNVDPMADIDGVTRSFPAEGAKATALVFITVDCPIANRYAPELRRIHEAYKDRGAVFHLVYVDFTKKPDDIRIHLDLYGLKANAIFDVDHKLVKAAEIKVTPEALVLDPQGRAVYKGRIDDTYVGHGRTRPEPTRLDLRIALDEILGGKRVSLPRTEAVGCDVPQRRSGPWF